MNQVTSKLDLDGENPVGRPSSMFARSGREAVFQDALDRYLADYRRQQALYTRPGSLAWERGYLYSVGSLIG